MEKFYITYCHPYGEVITNGEIYISEFDRYHFDGIKVEFTDNLDRAGFFCSLDLSIVLRYINMRFKNGVSENLIINKKF